MKEKVQIIGSVSGLPRDVAVSNFNDSKKILEDFGYEVVNPVELVPEDTPWHTAMKICIKSMMDMDAVAIQPDFTSSKGAYIEAELASNLHMKIIWL